MSIRIALLIALIAGPAATARAIYVEPVLGGGRLEESGTTPMSHADVFYDGSSISVQVLTPAGTPKLRPLEEPYEFDPNGTWGMINGHAYNCQYGWNPASIAAFPPDGTWIWVELIDASPGLEVYQREPAIPEGQPILGTAGSSTRWRWSGSMTHNLYAVESPTTDTLFATYRVYVGYEGSGDPYAGQGDAVVTLQWVVDPRLVGDYDHDLDVDADDYQAWRASYGAVGDGLGADGNQDGRVDAADYSVWRSAVEGASPGSLSPAPEPSAAALLLISLLTCRGPRTQKPRQGWRGSVREGSSDEGSGSGLRRVVVPTAGRPQPIGLTTRFCTYQTTRRRASTGSLAFQHQT